MKKILIVIAGIILTASVFAQAPEKMSYQAVIRNASNNLITNQAVGMQISILQGSATGTAVYVETQTPTTNADGLVSMMIGTGTTTDDFSTIDWANGTYFIKTETDLNGGANYAITGTTQLMSVPYALHAKTAESITGTVNYTETDPVFGASIANGITATDTTNWNNHTVNTDAQTLTVSQTGDTLTINGGNSVLVPGISLLNFPPSPAIGDNFQGGIIAYILQAGDPGYDATVTHGLIAAPTDQSSGIFWHVSNTGAIGATGPAIGTGTAIGTGAANTAAIIALYGAEANAAKLCDDLVIGPYTDWYLPSADELRKLYDNRVAIGGFDTSTNPSAFYWSSTEGIPSNAYYFGFAYGYAEYNYKDATYSVRAVRAF